MVGVGGVEEEGGPAEREGADHSDRQLAHLGERPARTSRTTGLRVRGGACVECASSHRACGSRVSVRLGAIALGQEVAEEGGGVVEAHLLAVERQAK